mmetsp:Transcript_42593/g.40857  ORF Transcript_42593/g.40857 Transcript_42593/m.40857 type:complete len:208 (-) Transcript_42593:485-1108(-)
MSKLMVNSIELAQNPYGNYAIQQVFEHWDKQIIHQLIPCYYGKVFQLSMQKCSSNVIDRCIQNSSPDQLQIIMSELINCDRLTNLIMNSYGNFVVQNALKFATQEDRLRLAEQIQKTIPSITDQKIKQKWTQLLKRKNLQDLKNNVRSQEPDYGEPLKNRTSFPSSTSVNSAMEGSGQKSKNKAIYSGKEITNRINPNSISAMPPPP